MKSVDGKKTEFKVLLGTHEIGTSKNDTDARFHMHAINDALKAAYTVGYKRGREDGIHDNE